MKNNRIAKYLYLMLIIVISPSKLIAQPIDTEHIILRLCFAGRRFLTVC